MIIPHSAIPISSIRPTDILLLLALGSITEILHRFLLRRTKLRTKAEKKLVEQLRILRFQTNKKRAIGPSAFVETSKLERIVLARERELAGFEDERKGKVKKMEKFMKYLMMGMSALIFFAYYSIPLIAIDGIRATDLGLSSIQSDDHAEHAAAYWKGVMFPLSYVGIGLKLSRIGLENKASCVGALSIYWSAQVMVGKVYECVEALVLR